jgi:hypothetical protein
MTDAFEAECQVALDVVEWVLSSRLRLGNSTRKEPRSMHDVFEPLRMYRRFLSVDCKNLSLALSLGVLTFDIVDDEMVLRFEPALRGLNRALLLFRRKQMVPVPVVLVDVADDTDKEQHELGDKSCSCGAVE